MKDAMYFDPRNAGWMEDAELNAIRELAAGKGEVLEVGCYCGRSTRALLEATHGFVVAIDPLHRNGWMPQWPMPGGLHLNAHAHMADLVAQNPTRLIVIPAFSREMYKLFKRPVDVLMIDSDHSYQNTLEEIDAFAPLVRDGGVIFLDDYDLEPIKSAWENCHFRKLHPWLVPTPVTHMAFVKVVLAPPPDPPEGVTTAPPITATPV